MGFSREGEANDFLGEAAGSRSEMERAATRIQSLFKGYSVRRCKPLFDLRVIDGVRRSLAALQARAADPTYIERICTDVFECRRLTEGIMALLLKLDALQDVHATVRDVRKSVSREVIQFMEVIDAVVVGAESSPWQDSRNNPGIVRSNSIPHLDRTSSYPLRRIMSLDNHMCPEQVNEPESGTNRSAFEPRDDLASDRDEDLTLPAEMAVTPVQSMASLGFYGLEGESERPSSELEQKTRHPDTGAVRLLSTEAAALVVQARFRGYRVRRSRPLKHLRKISNVKSNLKELVVLVSSPGFTLKLRLDGMERVKLTESITALLLELDSVQGVDQVVRDIRKSATRDVFKLQESVDAMIIEAETGKDTALSSHESEEVTQEQRIVEDFGVQLSTYTPAVPEKDNSRDSEEFESVGDEGLHGVSEEDSSQSRAVRLQPMDVQPMYTLGRPSDPDMAGTSRPPSERQRNDLDLDHAAVSPMQECGRGLDDDVQVSVVDISMQSCTTLGSCRSAADGQGNDRQSGPCAAVLSATDCTAHDRSAQFGTVPLAALRDSSALDDDVQRRPLHFGDMKAGKVGSGEKLHDKYVPVLDADLQASAILCDPRQGSSKSSSASLIRHVYDAQHMETAEEVCMGKDVNSRSTLRTREFKNNVGPRAIPREDSINSGFPELDLMLQKFNFIPNSCLPRGAASDDAQSPASHPSLHSESECQVCARNLRGSLPFFDLHRFDERSAQRATGMTRKEYFLEDKSPANALDYSPLPFASHSLRRERAAPAGFSQEQISEGVQTPAISSEEGFLPTFNRCVSSTSLDDSSEPTDMDMDEDDVPSVAVVESKKRHHNGDSALVSKLVDENTKLMGLVMQVLDFAEKQSAKVMADKGKIEKLEGEIVQYRKRDEALRKKSKTARRRR